MPRSLRIAALQLRAHDRGDYERRLPQLARLISQAAEGTDLLVLPEGTAPAYVLGNGEVEPELLARTTATLSSIASERSCAIVAGVAVRREDKLYNGALVIDRDGTLAGSAEKIFLWHFDRQWYSAGTSIAPIETSIGSLGVLICADGRMPAIANSLARNGAELLVMPTAWVTSGRDPAVLENMQADLLVRVRAFENRLPFVAANKCGTELGMVAYCGKSQIVDARGELLALGSERNEEVVRADVTIAAAGPSAGAPDPLAPRGPARATGLRVALASDALPSDIADRLRVLEADVALGACGDDDFHAFDAALGAVRIGTEEAFDPRTLLAYRRAGYCAAVVDAPHSHPWLERVARARAAELRLYVIVFDREAERAYAVDPDGAIVAGTFDGYRIASFSLDVRRTQQTLVAPGTDVAAGIERVHAMTAEAV